ncbi:MAG: LacI family DNA-binding transcriptional regulator [Chitinivibrionales bacterium]|nr:LacI family DNA-binding transcriptional regulator [Chitinivibrionales bacterium]
MALLADIARKSGVSKTTVSLILNGKAEQYRISPQTAQRVRKVARDAGFAPNALARGLRTNRSGTIGLIVSDITTTFFSRLAHQIELAAQQAGYHVIIANSNDEPDTEAWAVETLLAKSVDGLIISTVGTENTVSRRQKRMQIPVVYIDRVLAGPSVHCVTSDNRAGMFELTRTLLAAGFSDIAYIGGLPHLSTHRERLDGFARAHAEAGVALREGRLIEGGFSREYGYELCAELWRRADRPPQALITAAMPLFEGTLAYLRESHGGVPHDLQLATFDDHPLLDHLAFAVPSVRQDWEAMGAAAFDALQQLAAQRRLNRISMIKPVFVNRLHSRRRTP